MNKSLLSSNSDEWYTPIKLFTDLDQKYNFTLDPCANGIYKLKKYIKEYNKETNGLIQNWNNEIVFCNPPYSKIKDWTKKCYEESLKGTKIVLLIPSRTDTQYFHNYIYKKDNIRIEFIKGRLKFSNCNNSAPFPSMLVFYNL